ncbi:MAG: 1-acyl-sn-glycerol-3-phosphate acyltransferase [Clostridia bacterium]|nr:1-acyl-sn-glycerol-3-phosphate acyltransferase [Clostridia bacterium]
MLFTILRPILTLWIWLFYPLKVRGKENISHEGNTVLICNHLSMMDIFFVGYLFKGKTFYIAKKEIFKNKVFGWLIKQLGGIPLDREKVDLESTKMALSVLKSGKRLCIFPEGKRNKQNTDILPLHGGAGMYAFKCKSAIIPINIHNKAKFWGKNSIYVGKKFNFSQFYGQKLDVELNEKLTQIMYEQLCVAKEEHENLIANKK